VRHVSIETTSLAFLMMAGAIQEYQIRRLLSYKSGCQVEAITETASPVGTAHYHADCRNLTSYPDGVEIACEDGRDERSCHALTQAKSFRPPDLLAPRNSNH
jgi:hypothetical protein